MDGDKKMHGRRKLLLGMLILLGLASVVLFFIIMFHRDEDIMTEGSYMDFTYLEPTENGGEIMITGYTGASEDVKIPSAIHGLPVTGIKKSTFGGCTSLKSMKIPDSVTEIWEKPWETSQESSFGH